MEDGHAETAPPNRPTSKISIQCRKVKLTVWTHKIDGLTESDFILAAKADKLLNNPAPRQEGS